MIVEFIKKLFFSYSFDRTATSYSTGLTGCKKKGVKGSGGEAGGRKVKINVFKYILLKKRVKMGEARVDIRWI